MTAVVPLTGAEVGIKVLESVGVVKRLVVGVEIIVGVTTSVDETEVVFKEPVSVGEDVTVELVFVSVPSEEVLVGIVKVESVAVVELALPGVVMVAELSVAVVESVGREIGIEIEISVALVVVVGAEESFELVVVGRITTDVGAVPTKVVLAAALDGVGVGRSVERALVTLSTTLLTLFKMLESIPPRSVVADVVVEGAAAETVVDSAVVPSVGVTLPTRVAEVLESVEVGTTVSEVVGPVAILGAAVESVATLVPVPAEAETPEAAAEEVGKTPVGAALDSTEVVEVAALDSTEVEVVGS